MENRTYFTGQRVLLDDDYIGPATITVEKGKVVEVVQAYLDDITKSYEV